MVKNTTGGSSHKSQARKMVSSGRSSKLRLSEDELECYACVTRMCGNGMCYVVTYHDNKQMDLLCHIRGKFRTRNKKNNFVSVNSIVLIGIREWEAPNYEKCDLLEVYDIDDTRILQTMPGIDLRRLEQSIISRNERITATSIAEVIFSADATLDFTNSTGENEESVFTAIDGESVSIDDI